MNHVWPIPKIEYCKLADIEESLDVALFFTRAALDAVSSQLDLPVVSRAEVLSATVAHWEELADAIVGDIIYAVGGGLAVDAAKFAAATLNRPLVCIPTALSVDAFLTWASGYRKDGWVRYIETKPPDLLIADLDTLGKAPASLRAAGLCDVLSIATGCADWELAERADKNLPEHPYRPAIVDIAKGILNEGLACAEAAGRGDAEGLQCLLDCLALEVQLCNQIGHSRPEEGSEHYFAYAVENETGPGLPHGDLVGPGIVLMARAQGLDIRSIEAALHAGGVPLNSIAPEVVASTLRRLPAFCTEHNAPYGIAHTLSADDVQKLTTG